MGAVKLVRRRERSKQRWQARKSLENGETPACLGIDKLGYSVGLELSAEKFDKGEEEVFDDVEPAAFLGTAPGRRGAPHPPPQRALGSPLHQR